jgi:hypothetical protein
MVNPFKKIRAGFVAHSIGEAVRESVVLKKDFDTFPQEFFRLKRQRPIKTPGFPGILNF